MDEAVAKLRAMLHSFPCPVAASTRYEGYGLDVWDYCMKRLFRPRRLSDCEKKSHRILNTRV